MKGILLVMYYHITSKSGVTFGDCTSREQTGCHYLCLEYIFHWKIKINIPDHSKQIHYRLDLNDRECSIQVDEVAFENERKKDHMIL